MCNMKIYLKILKALIAKLKSCCMLCYGITNGTLLDIGCGIGFKCYDI